MASPPPVQAVGFNTIPASASALCGALEQRDSSASGCARRLLEDQGVIVVDEFTSIVDRQVAKEVGAHAMQKAVRKSGRRFASRVLSNFDIVDWLQPVVGFLGPRRWRSSGGSFDDTRPGNRASACPPRPSGSYSFAPFHYLTADLANAAQCWYFFIEGQLGSFAGVLHRPHQRRQRHQRESLAAGDAARPSRLGAWHDPERSHRVALRRRRDTSFECTRHWRFDPQLQAHSRHWRLGKKARPLQSQDHEHPAVFGSRPCAVFSCCARADGTPPGRAPRGAWPVGSPNESCTSFCVYARP